MTISRESNEIYFECDWSKGCSEILEAETEDFHEALDLFKSEGWLNIRKGEDWIHLCPYHKAERAKAMSQVKL